MKLLIVTPYYPPHFGGVQNYVYHLAKRLKSKYGWEVIVVTSGPSDQTEVDTDGVTVIRLRPLFKLSNTPIHPLWLYRLWRIVKLTKPDVINAHIPVPGMADLVNLVRGSVPLVTTYHVLSIQKKNWPLNFLLIWYEKKILNYLFQSSQKIICCSQAVYNSLSRIQQQKATVITPGVDVRRFNGSQTKDRKNLLFVANLTKSETHKGLASLLHSFRAVAHKVEGHNLLVAGGGDYLHHYQVLAAKLDLADRVIFLGKKKPDELAKIFAEAALFILPSENNAESFGMVIAEAMACKTPVLASNVGGVPYLVEDCVNGYLVEAENTTALSKKIVDILTNYSEASQLAEIAYRMIHDNYTWEHKTTQTYELLRQFQK